MENIERHFSTGSVEVQDPYDKHLDSIGYYRKHTARDASSLFRVVSEQIYDTQMYHGDIREICVSYMALKRSTYEKLVATDLDFDEYLTNLSKPRTFGTLAELHALAYRFKRNVLLFEPHNTGNWYISEPEFSNCLLVFYVPQKHFDSIYSISHMESVAFCQSFTYEIMYSHVFKLPDVIYAVERMLHDENKDTYISQIEVSPYDESQESLTLSDGRHFILDHADDTECILENYLLCHFHNIQFHQITNQLHRDSIELQDDPDALVEISKWFRALLPRRNVSCVRQLLDENITPFPYKVAKALDTHIYRNIEFDVWNDARKKARLREWRQGETLQVGVKCLVNDVQWNQEYPYTAYIQEIDQQKGICDVYIETMGVHRTVPFSSVTLPKKSWMISNGQHEKNKMKNVHATRDEFTGESFNSEKKKNCGNENTEEAFHYFTKPLHIPQQYREYIACPQYNSNRPTKNTDSGKGTNSSTSNKNATNKKELIVATVTKPAKAVELPNVENEPPHHLDTQVNVGSTNTDWNTANQHCYSNVQHNPGYRRRTDVKYNYRVNNIASMIKRKDLLPSMHQINANAQESSEINGRDLPYNDVQTLRFFYNLGIDFLRVLHQTFPANTISTFFNPVDSTAQHGRYQQYYENSNECTDLSADFYRSAQISSKDQYSKTTDNGQQHHRSYSDRNTSTTPKKYSKNYRYDYSKSKRPFAEDTAKYPPNYNRPPAESTTAFSKPKMTACNQTTDAGIVPQFVQPPPQPFYPCYPGDISDSTNMYVYGYYPSMNDNMVAYQMLPSGLGLSESDEFELAQTYPYYNPTGTYYYSQPYQPMAQQAYWYAQPVPMTIPTSMATPIPSTSYGLNGQYTVAGIPGTNDNHSNNNIANNTSVPFTPNEQLIDSKVNRTFWWSKHGE